MSRSLRTPIWLLGIVAAVTSTTVARAGTLPSVPSSAYPYYQTLKHYTFDAGANPDAQGWTTHDLTAQQGTFWHVDNFAGILPPYVPIEGGKSLWCGVRAGVLTDPLIQHAPGYGDGWTQIFQSVPLATVPDDFSVLFRFNTRRYMVGGDRLDVEYRLGSGPWTLLGSITGIEFFATLYEWEVLVAEVPSTIQFRLVFTSDFNDSDESGPDTNGAVIVDYIEALSGTNPFFLPRETFEAYAPGTTATTHWTATIPAAFGNYAGLVSGAAVTQAGTPNTTHVWSFFNGSSETYACGGSPSQPAVPKTTSPGSTRPTDYLWNEVRSPWIDLSVDQNSQPVDPAMGALAFEFDAYADLNAVTNRVRYTYRYRFMIGGVMQEWHMYDAYRSSDIAQWVHEDVFTLGSVPIPAGATHVQLGLVALDFAYAGGITGTCHSQSPLFDNVSVIRMYSPVIVTGDGNSGVGSMRQAIVDANANPDFNTMLFDIPGGGAQRIALTAPLPAITQPLWIDGFSQAGSSPNTTQGAAFSANLGIAVDGSAATAGDGISFAPGSYGLVRGLAIGGFSGAGIRYESTSLFVTGCYIGTDAYGTTANPNGTGILSVTQGLDIGGPLNQERMLISANLGDAIRVLDGSCHIFNCRIGYDSIGYELTNGDGIHVLGGTGCQIGQPTVNPCDGEYTDRVWLLGGTILVDPAASGVMISQIRFDSAYIDLGVDGPTPNDPLDADSGANGLQNFPVLTSADGSTIIGNMDGLPNQTHRIEFYSGDGYYGLSRYLGYQNVTTNGAGHGTINFSCGPIPPASMITATATAALNTSEVAPWITSMNTPPNSPLIYLYDQQNILRASVEFDDITVGGNTFIGPALAPAPPVNWNVGGSPLYWDLSTTAAYNGSIQVFLHYNPAQVPGPEHMLRLLHYDNGVWVDITGTVDTDGNRIGGLTSSLSPFVLAVPAGATPVGETPAPERLALHPNVPNPFNPVTTIHYDVPAGGADVAITVFDVRGALVRTLVNAHRSPGQYVTEWNGEDSHGVRAASGVYFYRMTSGGFVETRKMVLLK